MMTYAQALTGCLVPGVATGDRSPAVQQSLGC